MILRQRLPLRLLLACLFLPIAFASYGDRLPEFKECVEVCKQENCAAGQTTSIPLLHRLLLWDCPSECDYTCQHIITNTRTRASQPTVQFHGKWPFHRMLGMQEPASVLFSLLNLLAHHNGLSKVRAGIPRAYALHRYYVWLAYLGMLSWTCSVAFHTRDLAFTEQMDYFAAGASVLYGLYYSTIRIFRLDAAGGRGESVLRAWTLLCAGLYVVHVAYLKLWAWDYGYNMAANVVVGVLQNAMWSWFSWEKYRRSGRAWAMWPGFVVACVILAMSLELLDFAPWWGVVDAHSLWHLATVAPTVIWYNFLLKDAQDDMAGQRLKA